MISTLAFALKVIRPIIFSAVKNVSFPHSSRKFPLIMEFFHSQEIEILHNQGTFPVKEFFHSQRIFPQKILLNQGSFPQISKFSIVKEIFHTENLLDQGNFLQTRKFSKNFFFP